ncbi:transposase (plasmid) [Roseomonas sp. OT10]|uniref:IS66-like element accessory protein TnpA n=1 Tax=Roseomonas cutis TaxID=2897332 RepID=UPI001E5A24EA|nr:transposase [Roseomonas sp. OT10]UFN51564.1 transposase [Roseomonas sp. OT10]
MISVVQRRRRWTTEQKLALIEETMCPGTSLAGVADRHGVSRSLLFEWRRQAREGTMPGLVPPEAERSPSLVPVHLVDGSPPEATSPAFTHPEQPVRDTAGVEVVLRNSRILRVSEAIRPEVLRRLAAALEA